MKMAFRIIVTSHSFTISCTFLLLLSSSGFTDGTKDACQKIGGSLCSSDLFYNWTALPNSLDHSSQDQADLAVSRFLPLLETGCSQYLRKFLCSYYFPVCIGFYKPIFPCRSLCQKVRNQCRDQLKDVGIEWPDHLLCSEFPADGMCVSEDESEESKWSLKLQISEEIAESEDGQTTEAAVEEANCEKISLPQCISGLPYKGTSYPNLMGHETQDIAWQNMFTYEFLVARGCSANLRFFLCLMHAPMCTLLSAPIPPCKSLCRRVKNDCKEAIRDLDILWPSEWNCKLYPTAGLCIGEEDLEMDWFWRRRAVAAGERRRFELRYKSTEGTPDGSASLVTTVAQSNEIPVEVVEEEGDASSSIALGDEEEKSRTEGGDMHKRDIESESDDLKEPGPDVETTVPVLTLGSCENVREPFCRVGIPYNWTAFPNSLGHGDQAEAGQNLEEFEQFVVGSRRSINLRLFLCSVYVPVCTVFGLPMPPCQSLCRKAEEYFNGLTNQPWPAHLQCFQYPLFGLCFAEVEVEDDPPTTATTSAVTKKYVSTTNAFQQTTQRLITERTFARQTSSSTQAVSSTVGTTKAPTYACHDLTLPFCTPHSIQYNRTIFPNFLGHANQVIATHEMSQYEDLINSGCSVHIRFFLCTMYAPICTVLINPIPPCRELCELIRSECMDTINSLEIPWPGDFECDKFPSEGFLCVTFPEKSEATTVGEPIEVRTPVEAKPTQESMAAVQPGHCQMITIPQCVHHNLQYNETVFPNLFGHVSQAEAEIDLNRFNDLLDSACSSYLRFLLCTTYAPICTVILEPIPPCRSFCEKVTIECQDRIVALAIDWPEELQCERLPSTGLCVGQEIELGSTVAPITTLPEKESINTGEITVGPMPNANEECQEINIDFCTEGLPYRRTVYPNFLGHTDQNKASQALSELEPLMNSECADDLRVFVCNLFVPMCILGSQPLPPCQSLCQQTLKACKRSLRRSKIDWPDYLQCENFPVSGFCNAQTDPLAIETEVQELERLSEKCESVHHSYCLKNAPYTMTYFPNNLLHGDHNEASQQMDTFNALIKTECSDHLGLFLCTAHFPMCADFPTPVLPCRSLCRNVRKSCRRAMKQIGIRWPSVLQCRQFPVSGLCIGEIESIVSKKAEWEARADVVAMKKLNAEGNDRITPGRCQALKASSICRALLPYNMTVFPNVMGIQSQDDAEALVQTFIPLREHNCFKRLKFFACSSYYPECNKQSNKPIFPCRSLCEEVTIACETLFQEQRLEWPEKLQCQNFPPSYSGQCSERAGSGGTHEISMTPIPNERDKGEKPVRGRKCESLSIPMCLHDLPYNTTSYPNMLGHESQEDARLELHQFIHLVETRCSEYLKPFLCASFAPPCRQQSPSLIYPCRSICEKAREDCELPMRQLYGFSWPSTLECANFPETGNCLRESEGGEFTTIVGEADAKNKEDAQTSDGDCQQITIPLCRNSLSYDVTSYPNVLNHRNQLEARLELHQLLPLDRLQCSQHFTSFICNVYTPPCRRSGESLALPCRSLCEKAKLGCESAMGEFGFSWPSSLQCENFPSSGECIEKEDDEEVPKTSTSSVPDEKDKEDAAEKISENKNHGTPQTIVTDVHESSGNCQRITVPLCRDFLPYNETTYPNFLKHKNQLQARLQIQQYSPLVKADCSPLFRVFICSIFTPPCQHAMVSLLLPCRGLCEKAKLGCESLLSQFGFNWPSDLHCENFPSEGTCIGEAKNGEKLVKTITLVPGGSETGREMKMSMNTTLIPGKETKTSGNKEFTSPDNKVAEAGEKCEDITVTMCKDALPYSITLYPNFLKHRRQDDARMEVHQFYPLIRANCSPYLKPFLCSVYVPPCQHSESPAVILPCRSLCKKAKHGCTSLLEKFGFSWPSRLDCANFPTSGTCIAEGEEDERAVVITSVSNEKDNGGTTEVTEMTTSGSEKEDKISGKAKCENITIPLCMDGLPYNLTSYPNFLNHRKQDDAGLEAHQFFPLVKVQCSPYLKPFLCSVYAPMCRHSENPAMILPCRSLCNKAKHGCASLMEKFGFSWPSRLDCTNFPTSGTCIAEGEEDGRAVVITSVSSEKDNGGTTELTEMTTSGSEKEDKISGKAKCENITIPLCMDGLPYNLTSYPNFLNHRKQDDAGLEAHQFFPLIKVQCSPYLKPFLCSVYAPMCRHSENSAMILPCRSLCKKAKHGCALLMEKFGFSWPSRLDCTNFPTSGTCIAEGEEDGRAVVITSVSSEKDNGRTTELTEMTTSGSEKEDKISGKAKCENITIPLCMDGLPYNLTSYPNFLNHRKQDDAGLEAHQFFPLIKVQCSPYLKPFLCSVYAPMCRHSENSAMILPCRSLCKKAKHGCALLMEKFGFSWPSRLDCTNFPTSGTCIAEGEEDGRAVVITSVSSEKDNGGTTELTEMTTSGSEKEDKISGKAKCENITIPLCMDGLPYNLTSYPNFLNHRKQDDAGLEAHQFFPLIKVQCSPYLKPFLCSVYAPMCRHSENSAMILPCRSLCKKAKHGCALLMEKFGFSWPSRLDCTNFPTSGTCIAEGEEDGRAVVITSVSSEKDNGGTTEVTEMTTSGSEKEDKISGKAKCENITIPLCMDGLPYNLTSYPNFLNHRKQDDAGLEAHQFFPLIKVQCSPYLKPFLCSVYAPMCRHSENSAMILPCRSLCNKAKHGCALLMEKFGFSWPSRLDCTNFPTSGTCIAEGEEDGRAVVITSVSSEKDNGGTTEVTEMTTSGSEKEDKISGKAKCENITIPLCMDGLPYNLTSYPNFLNHRKQDDAGLEAHQFFPLIKVQCSPYLKPFLCSVYAPMCRHSENSAMILPCRSLCNKAKHGCALLMEKFGFSWPSRLDCTNFPTSGTCIAEGEEDGRAVVITSVSSEKDNGGTTEVTEMTTSGSEKEDKISGKAKCENITIPLCMDGLPYNLTSYPNFLNHRKQDDAGLEAHQFFPLIKVQCSPYLKPFLCSVYAPMCRHSENSAMILPCRSLCNKAKHGCALLMEKFGFSWPSRLDCTNFPTSGTCIAEGEEDGRAVVITSVSSEKDNGRTTELTEMTTSGSEKEDKISGKAKCENITIPLCMDGLPYNLTSYPNFLNHRKQDDAGLEAHQFFPLIRAQCSPYLKLFLCSLYAPFCQDSKRSEMILPCHSLCIKAKRGCEPMMNKFGFHWPFDLECEQFPESGLCIGNDDFDVSSHQEEDNKSIENPASNNQCLKITMPLCRDGLSYNMTSYPNVLKHKSQFEAASEMNQYTSLTKTQCSEYLKPFLCLVHAPPCNHNSMPSRPPCRSLCQKIKDDCEDTMNAAGFSWPNALNCKHFPVFEKCLDEHWISLSNSSMSNTKGQSSSEIRCEHMTSATCLSVMPYNMTEFPNALNQSNQKDASMSINHFMPLAESQCSLLFQQFACAMYFPPCRTNSTAAIVVPCRSFCEKTKRDCEDVMTNSGNPWPSHWQCESLPESNAFCLSENWIEESGATSKADECGIKKENNANGQENILIINPYHESCQVIESGICDSSSIPYNTTSFPNWLGYPSQEFAEKEIQVLSPLVTVGCSEKIKLFLCSTFFPQCTGTSDHILPCRSLCETVRGSCETLMTKYGFSWPACLDCERFPKTAPCRDESTTVVIGTPESTKTHCKFCEDINKSTCKDILSYNKTLFPNAIGHENQISAMSDVKRLDPLVKIGCSTHMEFFLCSSHVPKCGHSSGSLILPCRSLCEKVRDDCESVMKKFELTWPDNLQCHQFPVSGLCVTNVDAGSVPVTATNTNSEQKQVGTEGGTDQTIQKPEEKILSAYEVKYNQSCESVSVPFCKGELPYDMTAFPSWFNHPTQEKAAVEFHQFYPLIQVECSEVLRLFLCSSHIPMCSNETNTVVPPCRSTCEKARDSCQNFMKKFGFSWPDRLRCGHFPESEPCVGLKMDENAEEEEEEEEHEVTTEPPLKRESCRAITVPFCQGDLPYEKTAFPNALGHENQEIATNELHQFYPLVQVECSKYLRLFLCSVIIPPCENSTVILPCKSLCNSVRIKCRVYMNQIGFRWPKKLHCDQFPEDDVCLPVPSEATLVPEIEHVTTDATEVTETEENGMETVTDRITESVTERVTLPPHHCEPIKVSICRRDLPYKMTSFPNALGGVNTQKAANVQLRQFYPLMKASCSKHIHLLLCSVYTPMCESDRKYTPPCRSLCRKARKECRSMVKKFGIRWPSVLQCKRFTDEKPCLR